MPTCFMQMAYLCAKLQSMHVLKHLAPVVLSVSVGWLPATAQKKIDRIAFGSCSHQDSAEQLWPAVIAQKPDLFVWLGDNIYGDTHNMDTLRLKYQKQKQHPAYQALLRAMPVIGTWDDHDYGVNDGGRFYPKKEHSKELMLDFLDVPAQAAVRKRKGVYQSHVFGEKGKQVKIILLDTRTFRDTLLAGAGNNRYNPNPTGDVLGEEQWTWLEKEIKNSKADVHIIGTSIQFLAQEHGYEKWANFPAARQRMLKLLVDHQPKNLFFISGDRHIAEISKLAWPGLPYPLYDFTSSGLTHTWSGARDEPNALRVGQLIIQKNFGLIRINWEGNLPLLEFEVRGAEQLYQSIPVLLPRPTPE